MKGAIKPCLGRVCTFGGVIFGSRSFSGLGCTLAGVLFGVNEFPGILLVCITWECDSIILGTTVGQ